MFELRHADDTGKRGSAGFGRTATSQASHRIHCVKQYLRPHLLSQFAGLRFHCFLDFRENGSEATIERNILGLGLTHLRIAAAHVLFFQRAEKKKALGHFGLHIRARRPFVIRCTSRRPFLSRCGGLGNFCACLSRRCLRWFVRQEMRRIELTGYLEGMRSMLRMGIIAITFAISAVLMPVAAVSANEIEHANATLGAIDRDRVAVHDRAAHFYREMNRAHEQLQWHAWMERVRGEEMTRAACARPQSQGHWAHCNGLYNQMQAHARWRQHLASIADQSRAWHVAAIQQLDQIARADHWWRTRLAALKTGDAAVASGRPAAHPLETGTIDSGRWSRVVR